MGNFNVLVIGAGIMGSNHVRTFGAMDGVKVNVADISREALSRIKLKFPKVETYDNIENALENSNADACVVATPTVYHPDTSLKVIDADLPLLVEKPLATNTDDAKKIMKAAQSNDVLLQVGHIERFNPAVSKLRVNMKNLGDIVYASAHRFGVPSFRKLDNVILDLAVHDIDVLTFLTGERPKHVSGEEKKIISEQEDLSTLVFDYGNFLASVESNTVIPIKIREMSVMGRGGIARLNYINQDLSIFRGEGDKLSYGTFDELVTRVGKGTEVRTFIQKEEPLKLELESFIRCVNNDEKPLVSGEDGVYAVSAAEAAIKSTATGKRERIAI
ncbi:MAG: Gfo/Idh/MocA family oxidoreductase [Candidatus Aenigmarchaeota archaeon]|nr:Gfo/Idh/MocA family oxidoreductase [Candidatus Aenigmarchaeota archaeon]